MLPGFRLGNQVRVRFTASAIGVCEGSGEGCFLDVGEVRCVIDDDLAMSPADMGQVMGQMGEVGM